MDLDLRPRRARRGSAGGRGGAVLSAPIRRAALALVVLGASAGGCVYSPKGRCDTAADCAAGEECSAGVCRPPEELGGGVDPTSFTTVLWSTVAGRAGASFAVDSVGADVAGNVVVAGVVSEPFDFGPDAVGTGAFVAKRAAANGAAVWATAFPTFSHDAFRTAVVPGGDVLFAGTAADPTTIVTIGPPAAPGALVVGRLRASDGEPLWARAFDATRPIAPVAVAVNGADLVVAGAGSANFGTVDTGEDAFVAALSAATGDESWSLGLRTVTLADVEARSDGSVVLAGVCSPAGATFEPELSVTCAEGLLVAALSSGGATQWARVSPGGGTVAAVHDVAVAPDGRVTVVGDASGVVDLGTGALDFGAAASSFAATFAQNGAPVSVLRPVEAPYAAEPDAVAFWRVAYDRSSRLWMAGTYRGQPTLGGVRFSACRGSACRAATFLARLEGGAVTSFLPLRVAPDASGAAYVDDLVLFATTNSVAHALGFTGVARLGGGTPTGSAGRDLSVLRVVP